MVKAHSAKETFWNIERVRRGWSFKYIAKKTGIPQSTLGYWFAGVKSPRNDRHIQQLCDLFEIPFDKGYNEFYHSERNWDSSKRTLHFYKTFWNDLREKNNLSLADVAEMTGIRPAVISSNFSGRNMPRPTALEKYCKLFDISLEQGKEEFKKAHEEYLAFQDKDTQSVEAVVEPVENTTSEDNAVELNNLDYTFWPSLFANAKFAVNEVALYLNVDVDKVAKYFTGELVPNFNQLRMLCNLYGGVDMTTGSTAFNLLHEHYLEEPQPSPKVTYPVNNVDGNKLIYEVLKLFFDKCSFDEFMELQNLLNTKDVAVLDKVYGVVSHKTYKALEVYVG